MPALPSPGKIIMVKLFFTYGLDTRALNRLYYSYTGVAPTQAQMASFASQMRINWGANIAAQCHGQVTLTSVTATDLSSVVGPVGMDATAVVGTKAGVALPAATSVLALYAVTRRYRGGHPRTYWPMGVAADLSNPDQWLPASVTAFTNALVAFDVANEGAAWAGAGTLDQANVSYYNGFTVITSPTTGRARNVPKVRAVPLVDLIGEPVAQSKPAYQRRRGLHGV